MFYKGLIQWGWLTQDSGVRKQTGEVFLESLIGVILTAWLGAGLAYCAGQIMVAKTDTKIINAAVMEMRQALNAQGDGLCNTTPQLTILGKSTSVAVTCQAQDALRVSSAGGAFTIAAPQKIELSVSAKSLGLRDGDDVVVSSGDRL